MISEKEKKKVLERFNELKKLKQIGTLPKNRKKVEEIYEKEIWPKVLENFENREKIDILISTVGFSFEPIVLSAKYFKPKKIVLLYTKESIEKSKKKVEKWLRKIKIRNIEERILIKKDISKEIFNIIKQIYKDNKEKSIVLDITGGTKTMPAAMAITAYYLKLRCSYIASEFVKELGKPLPFSERQEEFNAPLNDFIDLISEEVVEKINEYKFSEAKYILEEVKERSEKHIVGIEILLGLVGEVLSIIEKNKTSYIKKYKQKNYKISINNDITISVGNLLIKRSELLEKKSERSIGEDYLLEIIEDLIITNHAKEHKEFVLSYIYLQRVFEHIKNYLIEIMGENPSEFNNSLIDFERFKNIFKEVTKQEYKKEEIDKKLALINGLIVAYLLQEKKGYIEEVKKISLKEIKKVYNYVILRNLLVHSNIKEIQKIKINSNQIDEYILFAIKTINRLFSSNIKISDLKNLIRLE